MMTTSLPCVGDQGPSGFGELAGDCDDIHECAVAPYRDLESTSDCILDHGALQCGGRGHWLTGNRYNDVADPQTRARGGALRQHLRDMKPAAATRLGDHGSRKGHLRTDDPEPGPPDASLRHERGDDPAGRVVDGHRQTDANAGYRSVDPCLLYT